METRKDIPLIEGEGTGVLSISNEFKDCFDLIKTAAGLFPDRGLDDRLEEAMKQSNTHQIVDLAIEVARDAEINHALQQVSGETLFKLRFEDGDFTEAEKNTIFAVFRNEITRKMENVLSLAE